LLSDAGIRRYFARKRWNELFRPSKASDVAYRIWQKVQSDNVFGRAAELAYFFLFSIFPLLIILTSLLGFVSRGIEIRLELLGYFRTALPAPAYELVESAFREVNNGGNGGKLSIGIIVLIASAAAGMVAIIEGLNTAYEVREARTWIRRRMVAVILTIALVVFTVSAMAVFFYGNQLGRLIAAEVGFKAVFENAWPFIQWPLVVFFVVLAFALTYRFAPNVRVQHWRWIFPGAGVAFVLWLLASAGLRLYLRLFDPYSAVYGSLGALMILMVWFYLFGAAILIGGEVNSVLENAAAEEGDLNAKLPGEKAPGG
jgi:membrane protein